MKYFVNWLKYITDETGQKAAVVIELDNLREII
jgi:hypothetical protein